MFTYLPIKFTYRCFTTKAFHRIKEHNPSHFLAFNVKSLQKVLNSTDSSFTMIQKNCKVEVT